MQTHTEKTAAEMRRLVLEAMPNPTPDMLRFLDLIDTLSDVAVWSFFERLVAERKAV